MENQKNFENVRKINMAVCLLSVVLGLSAVVYKVNYEGGFLTCFREMTFSGSVFTMLVALAVCIKNGAELSKGTAIRSAVVYYFHLSSAVVGAIILLVTLIGTLPIFPDKPLFARYDMAIMHVLLPLMTMASFVFADAPIGKIRAKDRLNGLIFIILYAVTMVLLILLNVIPENKIPYSFLNVRHISPLYLGFAIVVIFGSGYLFSWLFSSLNRRFSKA